MPNYLDDIQYIWPSFPFGTRTRPEEQMIESTIHRMEYLLWYVSRAL